jgi:hypothetical protein
MDGLFEKDNGIKALVPKKFFILMNGCVNCSLITQNNNVLKPQKIEPTSEMLYNLNVCLVENLLRIQTYDPLFTDFRLKKLL